METAILIIYVIFIFIFGLNSFFLVKLTIKLSDLINNQDTIIKDQKTHLDFFNSLMDGLKKMFLEREDQIVKKFEAEKEGEIKEKEKIIKKLRTEAGKVKIQKVDVEKAVANLADQFAESILLVSRIIYSTDANPVIGRLISDMREGSAKGHVTSQYKRIKQELEKSKIPYPWEMLMANLKHFGAFLPDKDKSSSQK